MGRTCYKERKLRYYKKIMLVKAEGKRKEGRLRMRLMVWRRI
jgi:hypothetical protein